MDDIKLMLAENLKRIRLSKGWSQSFVANQLGICQRTISRAECGCGLSRRVLKMLCSLYQVSVSCMYKPYSKSEVKEIQVVPEDVAVGLLAKNGFIQDLEREVILRFTAVMQQEALMMRDDVELIIADAVAKKKVYSLPDVIAVAMAVNQQTLVKARQLIVA